MQKIAFINKIIDVNCPIKNEKKLQSFQKNLIECSYHVTYAFQSESTL